MGIAERIYEIVKQLPESTAAKVLSYAKAKRAVTEVPLMNRATALSVLDKHAGKFKAEKFNRDDLYDRAILR
jgi:hypothetical protein